MKDTELKQLIRKEIDKTKELIEMYKEEAKPVAPDCSIDILTRNDAMNNMSRVSSLLQQAQSKLSSLEYILSTVGTPEFGKCVQCRKKIPIGRILVRPESLHCIECAE